MSQRGRIRHRLPVFVLLLSGLVLALPPTVAAAATEVVRPIPARVELGEDTSDLLRLHELGIDVDAVFHGWARIYVNGEQLEKLQLLGFELSLLPDEGLIGLARLAEEGVARGTTRGVAAQYHTYATLTADLQQIAADHPQITRLITLGRSVQGRELWMMKISDNPDAEEYEPEMAYISSMHGDEVTGKELCFNFINHLTDGYGSDPRVTQLVDGMEIWIMPSMNPDGTELGQRWNAAGVDLNRNFPDQFVDPTNTTAGREPETGAVMDWAVDRRLMLSANMHGGALVANYPLDSNAFGSSTFTPAPDPDHDVFVSIARSYADNNFPMSVSNSHPAFDNGITNGADWYAINGGMQDWEYVWHGDFELTLEVSNTKWPAASSLPGFWDDNLESMLVYLERGFEGVHGIVTDTNTGAPLDARIYVDGSPFPTYSDPDVGDYHRLVLGGNHDLTVVADGYVTQVIPVTLTSGAGSQVQVQMSPQPIDLMPMAYDVEDGGAGDGFLTAGEESDLAVTLYNGGQGATALGAELIPTGWNAGVMRKDADFPDIGTGASGQSLQPHYRVAADPATPTGHKLGFALRWDAVEGSGTSEPFFVTVGTPQQFDQAAADLPITIPAFLADSTIESQLTFPSDVRVEQLRVAVNIDHTYIGELEVRLTSPTGTTVLLHDHGGGSQDDIVGTYGADLIPVESLAAFAGESAAGSWTLAVRDTEFGDGGSLVAWSLELLGLPPESSTPEMRFRDFATTPGAVQLRWWTYPGLDSYVVYRATDPASAAQFLDVTAFDTDPTDSSFTDTSTTDPLVFYLVTGFGPAGEGPKGHFGE